MRLPWPFNRRSLSFPDAAAMVNDRRARRTGPVVTNDTAMRHSAVWACLRLRADLISTMPIDTFRKIDGIQIETPKPAVLTKPGETVRMTEWMYSTQVDLDRAGNTFGLITSRDGRGLPAKIELVPLEKVIVQVRKSAVTYRVDGTVYQPDEVWHEKQFTLSGVPVGLSPVAYAAYSIGTYLSAQQFASEWFNEGAIPTARLKNTGRKLSAAEASLVKSRFREAVANHDLFVHGSDWDYAMIQVPANQTQFIETMAASSTDIARFFGCPADLIDAAVSGQSVTYASITQRNLQLLIMNVGPAIARRDEALSQLLPAPQFVKLNPDALLRMDPLARTEKFAKEITARIRVPSEIRGLENLQPFTDEQLAEFDRLFGPPRTPTPTGAPA